MQLDGLLDVEADLYSVGMCSVRSPGTEPTDSAG